ncbi:tetratricopeptide repeat protein [Algoriphagus namhaensis]
MAKNIDIAPEEYELIEAWLDGKASDLQKQSFAQKETSDPHWSQKVAEVKALREDLETYLLKTVLEDIHLKSFPAPAAKSSPIPSWLWGVAASVAILLVGWLGFQKLFSDPNQVLFEAYYQTDPGLITAMSGTDSYEFDRGMVDYKEGKYQEALARWQPLLSENPESDTLLYFVAMAQLETQDTESSQQYLEKLIALESSAFEPDAQWYLALILLQKGEVERAQSLLSALDRPEARDLLEKLQK